MIQKIEIFSGDSLLSSFHLSHIIIYTMACVLQKNTGKGKNTKKKNANPKSPVPELIHFSQLKQKSSIDSVAKHVAQLKNKARLLNDQSCDKIIKEEYLEAESDLQESERLLKESTKQTKKASKYLIVCINLNFACVSQGLWDFKKSLEYMEAAVELVKKSSKVSNFGVLKKIEEIYVPQKLTEKQISKIQLRRLKILAIYYLQLSGINSLTQNHQAAYQLICDALKRFQEISRTSLQEKMASLDNSDFENGHYNSDHNFILAQISKSISFTLKNTINISRMDDYLTETHRYLCEFETKTYQKAHNQNELKHFFSKLHISNVMRIQPIKVDDFIQRMNYPENNTKKQIYLLVFYVSICYYALSTQRRLIFLKQNPKKNSKAAYQEISLCQIHHLKAINLLVRYVPHPSPFLSHLVNSFETKFKINLMDYSSSMQHSDNIKTSRLKQIKCSTNFSGEDNSRNNIYPTPRRQSKFQTISIYGKSNIQKMEEAKKYIISYGKQKSLNKKINQQFKSNRSIDSVQKIKMKSDRSWRSFVSNKTDRRILLKVSPDKKMGTWKRGSVNSQACPKKHMRSKSQCKNVKRSMGIQNVRRENTSRDSFKQSDKEKNGKKISLKPPSIKQKICLTKPINNSESRSKPLYSENQYFGNSCPQNMTLKHRCKFIQVAKRY